MSDVRYSAELDITAKDDTAAAFQSVTNNLTNAQRQLTSGFQQLSSTINQTAQQNQRATNQTTQAVQALGGQLQAATGFVQAFGKAFIGSFSAEKIAEFTRASFMTYAEQERQMNRIQQVAGGTYDEIHKLHGEIADLSTATGEHFATIAKGLRDFTSLTGVTGPKAIEAIKSISEAADLSETSLEGMERAGIAAIDNLGVKAADLPKVMGVWSKTLAGFGDEFAMAAPRIMESMAQIGLGGKDAAEQLAGLFKVSLEGMGSARQAGNALQALFRDIADPRSPLGARMFQAGDPEMIRQGYGDTIDIVEKAVAQARAIKERDAGDERRYQLDMQYMFKDRNERMVVEKLMRQDVFEDWKKQNLEMQKLEKDLDERHAKFTADGLGSVMKLSGAWEDLGYSVGHMLDRLGASDALVHLAETVEKFAKAVDALSQGKLDAAMDAMVGKGPGADTGILNDPHYVEKQIGRAGRAAGVPEGGFNNFQRLLRGYATGGIVNQPQIATVGEAGPEAIVPLDGPNMGNPMAEGGDRSEREAAAMWARIHAQAMQRTSVGGRFGQPLSQDELDKLLGQSGGSGGSGGRRGGGIRGGGGTSGGAGASGGWSSTPDPDTTFYGADTPGSGQTSATGGLSKDAYDKMFAGTKLAGQYDTVIAAAKSNNVDPALVAAIMAHESAKGSSHFVTAYNNPAGIMDPATGASTGMRFATIQDGINYSARTIARNYQRGGGTIEGMSKSYAPVGAANDPYGTNKGWPAGIRMYMGQLSGPSVGGGKPGNPLFTMVNPNTGGPIDVAVLQQAAQIAAMGNDPATRGQTVQAVKKYITDQGLTYSTGEDCAEFVTAVLARSQHLPPGVLPTGVTKSYPSAASYLSYGDEVNAAHAQPGDVLAKRGGGHAMIVGPNGYDPKTGTLDILSANNDRRVTVHVGKDGNIIDSYYNQFRIGHLAGVPTEKKESWSPGTGQFQGFELDKPTGTASAAAAAAAGSLKGRGTGSLGGSDKPASNQDLVARIPSGDGSPKPGTVVSPAVKEAAGPPLSLKKPEAAGPPLSLKNRGPKKMAEGGVLGAGESAVVGEAGPEAVVPLDPMLGAFTGMGDPAGWLPSAGRAVSSEIQKEGFRGEMTHHPGMPWVGGAPPNPYAATTKGVLWAGAKGAGAFAKDYATHQAFPGGQQQSNPFEARAQRKHQLSASLGIDDIEAYRAKVQEPIELNVKMPSFSHRTHGGSWRRSANWNHQRAQTRRETQATMADIGQG